MKTKKHTIKALTGVCSTLALASSFMLFAEDAQAGRRHHRAAPNPSPALQSEASRKTDGAGQQAGSVSTPSPAAVSLPASLTGMAEVGEQQAGPDKKPSPAVVAHPAPLTGIEVSFKLDPRHTEGWDMAEGWVSPPISIHAGARDGATPTVEARVQVLDSKGRPVDLSPEWIPADSEMVTVTPSQGNEVRITVRHAGQSNLQVTSQKVSKQLSIMAWYQGDALQVEISQKQ